MKVKILTGMAGHKMVRNPGEIHDLDIDEATRLINAGYAEKVEVAGSYQKKIRKRKGKK